MISDLRFLEVQPGDELRAEQLNRLNREISKRTLRGGPGVRVKQMGTHQLVSYHAPRRGVDHAWKPSPATSRDGKPGLRFSRGLVNGIEPVVGKLKMSDPKVEALEIPGYSAAGDCLVFVELTLDPSTWAIIKAAMTAYKERPAGDPFKARKLICIAQEDGRISPRAFGDFGFAASDRKAGGRFKAWWWRL